MIFTVALIAVIAFLMALVAMAAARKIDWLGKLVSLGWLA